MTIQTVVRFTDNFRTVTTTWYVKDSAGQYGITKPITAKSESQMAVYRIAKRNFKAAQQGEHFLR